MTGTLVFLRRVLTAPGEVLTNILSRVFGLRSRSNPAERVPAQAKTRSALFLHHVYYQHHYLSRALRQRGWESLHVTTDNPNGPNARFMMGEDLVLYDPDPQVRKTKIAEFVKHYAHRYDVIHFGGIYWSGFFEESYFPHTPREFLAMKERGQKIAYTVSGCHDGVMPSQVNRISGGVCDTCIHQLQKDACNDALSQAWGERLEQLCDLIAVETDWPTPPRDRGPQYFHEPLTSCLDPSIWSPDLEPPEGLRLERDDDEVLVMHAVGNYEKRRQQGRDIKGTSAVLAAIDRLRAEGHNIRLVFESNRSNNEMRYIQAQADLIIDQLNYGRYGATTRQAMMLGRPVITNFRPNEPEGFPPLNSLSECPVIHADQKTLYACLKTLLSRPRAQWHELGAACRAYALRWHSAQACAERYERVYDRMMMGAALNDRDFYLELSREARKW